jgi:hypothetical protein
MRAFVTALLLLTATVAGAVEEADRSAIRGTIESQLEAFKRDDAAGAFAQAAPNIKERFGTEERFLSMVRDAYKPVYRPRTYSMGNLEETHVGLTQYVQIQDAEGEEWTAVYTVEATAGRLLEDHGLHPPEGAGRAGLIAPRTGPRLGVTQRPAAARTPAAPSGPPWCCGCRRPSSAPPSPPSAGGPRPGRR